MGLALLLACCKRDPGNLAYRQALRKAQADARAASRLPAWLANLAALPSRVRLKLAERREAPWRCWNTARRS